MVRFIDPKNGQHCFEGGPHLLAVDPTLHWANPPGGNAGRDSRPAFPGPGPYRGPVPIVTHVHGAHTRQESDGFAEAWYLPSATDIPSSYARVGSFYEQFRSLSPHSGSWSPGSAVFEYPNDQPATTLWYHDHTLGMTRLNVYAGPAGFYLIRSGPNDLPGGSSYASELRNSDRHPGPLLQRRWVAFLPSRPRLF